MSTLLFAIGCLCIVFLKSVNSDEDIPLKYDQENLLNRLTELERVVQVLKDKVSTLEDALNKIQFCPEEKARNIFDVQTIFVKIGDGDLSIPLEQRRQQHHHTLAVWTSSGSVQMSLKCEIDDSEHGYQWILSVNDNSFYNVKAKSILNKQEWKLYSSVTTLPKYIKNEVIEIEALEMFMDSMPLSLHLLTETVIEEVKFECSTNYGEIFLSNNNWIPNGAKAIHAHVFIACNRKDHFVIKIGAKLSSFAPWTDKRTDIFSAPIERNFNEIYLWHPGETDGFSANYGQWYTSLTIPLTSERTINWQIFGCGAPTKNTLMLIVSGYYM